MEEEGGEGMEEGERVNEGVTSQEIVAIPNSVLAMN